MLNQILKMNGFNGGVCLNKYVKEREYYLDEVMNKYQVDRGTAKSLFIRVLHGGSWLSWAKHNKLDTNIKYDFIEKLQNEMNDINQTISISNPRIREVVDKQRPNFDATITALYLQEIENRILEKVFNYFVDKGHVLHNTCVLCFDGLMLLKDSFKEELLEELNTLIKLTSGLDLKFIQKEMDHGFTEEQVENSQISKLRSYGKVKEEFEKHNFKVRQPLTYVEINPITNKLIKRDKNEFKSVYENLFLKSLRSLGRLRKLVLLRNG